MSMNKTKGNMYSWTNYTYNPIRGRCKHDCSYCSIKDIAKRFNQKQEPIHLVESELKTNLGEGKTIFVGSSCDLFAKDIPDIWISKVLIHCKEYPKNTYIFQSKDPERIYQFRSEIPKGSLIGTTIESNIDHHISKAPSMEDRAYFLGLMESGDFKRFVTIEPILKFDLDKLVELIKMCRPNWVNVGADSKHTEGLIEPSRAEVDALIVELKKFTEVKRKTNLERLQ